MSDTTAVVTQRPYISKEEAAKALDISPRRVLEYAQTGALRSEKIRNPDTNLWIVRIHAGDVERLRDERSAPRPRVSRESQTKEIAPLVTAAPLALPAPTPQCAPAAAPAAPARRWNSYEWAPWLTLDEAALYSGLTKAWLTQQAETGGPAHMRPINVRDMGKHARGGRWRFLRDDLCRA